MKSAYIPVTDEQQAQMLREIGVNSADDLFAAIPESLKLNRGLDLPAPLSEFELKKAAQTLAKKNLDAGSHSCFLGAGIYDHIIPSAVKHIISRQEFYTAYTPYQPEISQGVLQSMFEYQTMIAELTGMDAANASVYDGATALYEAVLLAARYTGRNEVLIARSVNPQYRKVLSSVLRYSDITIREIGFYHQEEGEKSGRINRNELFGAITEKTAAVVIQSPNFFGVMEDLKAVSAKVKEAGALLIAVCDPVSLGVFESPGALGADIAIGEAQPLGNPMNFGGPLLGYFAVKAPYLRRMPGRIVGETTDSEGRRGFVLTIQAREQHIRREKASSNICSNQALNALAATIYLCLVGPKGLREIALRSHQLAVYASRQLEAAGLKLKHRHPFFREFAVQAGDPARANRVLLADGIIGGYELADSLLLAFTEKRTREQIDRLVSILGGIKHG